jgi:hypothetical protein
MHGGHGLLAAGMAAIVNHRIAGSDYLKGNDWLHAALFDRLGDISRRNPDERSEIRDKIRRWSDTGATSFQGA